MIARPKPAPLLGRLDRDASPDILAVSDRPHAERLTKLPYAGITYNALLTP